MKSGCTTCTISSEPGIIREITMRDNVIAHITGFFLVGGLVAALVALCVRCVHDFG